jgi:hypothetical protein
MHVISYTSIKAILSRPKLLPSYNFLCFGSAEIDLKDLCLLLLKLQTSPLASLFVILVGSRVKTLWAYSRLSQPLPAGTRGTIFHTRTRLHPRVETTTGLASENFTF